MEDFDKFITPELRNAIQRFGFDKIAAKMYGVEEINEKTASEIIGSKLMTRLAEWRQVEKGLDALASLEKTSFSISDTGHKLDAEHYNAESEAAHRRGKAHDDYAGKDNRGGTALLATALDLAGLPLAAAQHVPVLRTMVPRLGGKASYIQRLEDVISERHNDYAAKKHEKGQNAYNPFGGLLTQSRHAQKKDKKDKE